MDLTKLSAKSLLELNKQIKEALVNKEKYILRLRVDSGGDLLIYYIDKNNNQKNLGWLDANTSTTEILKDPYHCLNYEEWKDKGMKFDTNIIEWKNGKYQLYCSISEQIRLRRIDISNGDIYNFNTCGTIQYCGDTNLLRFKHNLRPY